MGLEVLQKSDDPLELFEGVFQIALGLEKTFVGRSKLGHRVVVERPGDRC